MSSIVTVEPACDVPAKLRKHIEPREILTLPGVTWNQYVSITDSLPNRGGLRTAYDGQTLELMTTSRGHERWKELLGRLLETLTLQLDLPLEAGGQTTFRDRLIERGLEPDRCYWIAHAEELVGVDDWEAGRHPPPDIAIEIDVSRSSVDRQEIYARLGVPELWRFDGERLTALRLDVTGEYAPIEFSLSMPFLRVADLETFLKRDPLGQKTKLIREFIRWIKAQDYPQA
jgi:Uma2 family endonuclease